MSTSFQSNEWESEEEESSNSSEEFMYMYVRNKESKEGMTEIKLTNGDSKMTDSIPEEIEEERPDSLKTHTKVNEEILWSPHKDQIPVIGENGKCV